MTFSPPLQDMVEKYYFCTTKKIQMKILPIISLLMLSVFILGCNTKPKVNESDYVSLEELVNEKKAMASTETGDFHEVIAKEVLQANSYTYVNVDEGDKSYWIAVTSQNIEVGKTYYHSGGLSQENFKSKDLDRVFENLLLVSEISDKPVKSNISPGASKRKEPSSNTPTPEESAQFSKGVSLSDIFANPEKYSGKTITVHGRCIKVNNQIMGKNWVHLHDGTTEASKDLTITTQDNVIVGSSIIMEGKIILNKDFGSGYKYDIIMEEAHLK
jgi:starvation-inducible outer membrane lipoprotein